MVNSSIAPLIAGAFLGLSALATLCRWRGVQGWLGMAGLVTLLGTLVARGLYAGHWPLTNQYEFLLAFAVTTALAALLSKKGRTIASGPDSLIPSKEPRSTGAKNLSISTVAIVQTITLLLAAALALYAYLGLPASYRGLLPLPPAIDSIWFPFHVGVAALAYGAFALAGVAGGTYLLNPASRSPASFLINQAVAAGYPLLTLSILLGMIWAQRAWGRYWDWDVKEVWTLGTWLVFTLYWHLRHRPRWQGSRLAWLAMIGLGMVLMTLLGVGPLARAVGLTSLHLF